MHSENSPESQPSPILAISGRWAHVDDPVFISIPPSAPSEPDDSDLLTDYSVSVALKARVAFISFAIQSTINGSLSSIVQGIAEMEGWIRREEIVRVVGAGRALLAAAIPANRLAHAGVRISVLYDAAPMPNTAKGGAILAASASGRARSVLDLLQLARTRNPQIRILGVAASDADEFASKCDIFIGLDRANNPYPNPLQALADTSEYAISELLDAMVVAAARRCGLTEFDLRLGHEDLGATGPYRPEETVND